MFRQVTNCGRPTEFDLPSRQGQLHPFSSTFFECLNSIIETICRGNGFVFPVDVFHCKNIPRYEMKIDLVCCAVMGCLCVFQLQCVFTLHMI